MYSVNHNKFLIATPHYTFTIVIHECIRSWYGFCMNWKHITVPNFEYISDVIFASPFGWIIQVWDAPSPILF